MNKTQKQLFILNPFYIVYNINHKKGKNNNQSFIITECKTLLFQMINRVAISLFYTLTCSQNKTILKGVQPVSTYKHRYSNIKILYGQTVYNPQLNLKHIERVMKGFYFMYFCME